MEDDEKKQIQDMKSMRKAAKKKDERIKKRSKKKNERQKFKN